MNWTRQVNPPPAPVFRTGNCVTVLTLFRAGWCLSSIDRALKNNLVEVVRRRGRFSFRFL
jgi:hypothetical protein